MRKSVKKVLSGIMAGMMILTAAPVSAFRAAELIRLARLSKRLTCLLLRA